jgi:hypothetical protein
MTFLLSVGEHPFYFDSDRVEYRVSDMDHLFGHERDGMHVLYVLPCFGC